MQRSVLVQSTPLLLVALACLLPSGARAAKESVEGTLAISPKEFLQRALAAGDTRVLAVPQCGAETPGILTSAVEAPDAEGTHIDLDPGCAWVLGKEGLARLAKLRAYAEEYNRLLLEEKERQGLFDLYPRDAQTFAPEKKSEQEAITRRAKATLEALLGQPAPEVADSRLWKTYEGGDSRLWVETKLAAADFAQRFPAGAWKEIPLPAETLSTMHLTRTTPKSFMTCYVGKVDGQRAYVFWSAEQGTLALVVALR